MASGTAPIPIDSVDGALGDLAFAVAELILVFWLPAIVAERSNDLGLFGCVMFSRRNRIVAKWAMPEPK